MKLPSKKLILCLSLPLLIGILSALFTRSGMNTFFLIRKPFFAPPGWLFPIVWALLYLLMGLASYLISVSPGNSDNAIAVYAAQLFFNFFWSILFFVFRQFLLSFFWLLLLWVLIFRTIKLFSRLSKTAALLLIPYLLWVSFAGLLNFSIYLLN